MVYGEGVPVPFLPSPVPLFLLSPVLPVFPCQEASGLEKRRNPSPREASGLEKEGILALGRPQALRKKEILVLAVGTRAV